MESGNIANALRYLADDAQGGVLSTSNKAIIKGRDCSLLHLPQEKHPCSQKVDPKYVVTDLKNRVLIFHPSIFEKVALK